MRQAIHTAQLRLSILLGLAGVWVIAASGSCRGMTYRMAFPGKRHPVPYLVQQGDPDRMADGSAEACCRQPASPL